MTNAGGDQLSGHLVRFELYQSGASVDCIIPIVACFPPSPFGPTQIDLGQQVAATPTCPTLGCAAFANTGTGFAAGGFATVETAGQAKMTWTDVNTIDSGWRGRPEAPRRSVSQRPG